jgi:positive phototaxis protein PixI
MQISAQTKAAIDMENVQETMIAAANRFTLMPNLPNFVIGLFAHRNNVFWIVDLAQLLGFDALDSGADEYHLVILQTKSKVIGLAVRRVLLVDRFSVEVISSPQEANLPAEIVPFLQGCILSPDRKSDRNLEKLILILDGEAIATTKFG